MRLKVDLVRAILKAIESLETSPAGLLSRHLTLQAEPADVLYHCQLLLEAGLIAGSATRHQQEDGSIVDEVSIDRLTWNGHQFLESIQSDRIWSDVKKQMTAAACGMPFSVMSALAITYVKQRFGVDS